MDILSQREAPMRPEVQKIRQKYAEEKKMLVANQEHAAAWCETMKPHNATQRRNIIGMARAVSVSAQAGAIDYRLAPVVEGGDYPAQASQYQDRLKKLESTKEKKDQLRRDIESLEMKDRLARQKQAEARHKAYGGECSTATPAGLKESLRLCGRRQMSEGTVEPGTFLKDWLNEYGRPKRVPTKEESWLTYNRGPISIIANCQSKTTRGQDALTMTSLSKLGNSITGSQSRNITNNLGSSDPLLRFETTRSNANSYRRGRLAD